MKTLKKIAFSLLLSALLAACSSPPGSGPEPTPDPGVKDDLILTLDLLHRETSVWRQTVEFKGDKTVSKDFIWKKDFQNIAGGDFVLNVEGGGTLKNKATLSLRFTNSDASEKSEKIEIMDADRAALLDVLKAALASKNVGVSYTIDEEKINVVNSYDVDEIPETPDIPEVPVTTADFDYGTTKVLVELLDGDTAAFRLDGYTQQTDPFTIPDIVI